MNADKHERADQLRKKISSLQASLDGYTFIRANYRGIFVGYNGKGMKFEGERAEAFILLAEAHIKADLEKVSKEYAAL